MTSSRGRIPIIEYLRGLAALAVTVFHMTNTYAPNSPVRMVGSHGWLGVEVFFVISGFVIPLSLLRGYERYSLALFPNFLLRRITRLEPPYIVSIALVIVLAYASAATPGFRGSQPDYESGQIAAHLFYVIPFTQYHWVNIVYWTLTYEFAFYLFMGLAWPWIGAPERKYHWLLAVTAAGLGVASSVLPSRAMLFVIGISVYRSAALGQTRWLSGGVAAFAAALIAFEGEPLIAMVGTATAIAIYFGRRIAMDNRLGAALLWLGAISYSLYLVHVPVGGRVINLGRRFIEGDTQQLALSIVGILVAVAFAAVFHKLIEGPAIAFARRWRRKKAVAVA